jgi:HEAT repeat protein
MNTSTKNLSLGVAALSLASASPAAETADLDSLISRLKTPDDNVRGPAWKQAGAYGAPAVKPLAELMTHPDQETARAACRALGQVVHEAGQPGREAQAKAVSAALVELLSNQSAQVQRDALWLLSEIAGDSAVRPMAALLSNPQVREDARCALTRMPGKAAVRALRSALKSAPEEFKPALAQSLRVRDE